MRDTFRVEEVLRRLSGNVDELLAELRGEGLFAGDELLAEEADELRAALLWMRDLGVNAAGVDVALRLRRRLLVLEARVADLVQRLLDEADAR